MGVNRARCWIPQPLVVLGVHLWHEVGDLLRPALEMPDNLVLALFSVGNEALDVVRWLGNGGPVGRPVLLMIKAQKLSQRLHVVLH